MKNEPAIRYYIERGTREDLNELARLYDDLNDYLDATVNYPGWIKDIYPVKEIAEKGIQKGNLFVIRVEKDIVGSVILNHEPEQGYDEVIWGTKADYKEVFVVHTLVVHPCYLQKGVATELMNFAKVYGMEKKMKAIRLDVSINNTAAINLYEKMGYIYVGTVDLGLEYPHLKWFKLYELIL